jgi:hypothetical protein
MNEWGNKECFKNCLESYREKRILEIMCRWTIKMHLGGLVLRISAGLTCLAMRSNVQFVGTECLWVP